MNQSSIKDIYNEYFGIIDSYFGSIKHYLTAEKNSHIELGRKIAHYPIISDLIYDAIDSIDDDINEFWSKYAKTIYNYLTEQNTLKCIYSGSLTPSDFSDFVKRSAMYVDTIIIPDPILSLTIFRNNIEVEKEYFLNQIIRHVFNIWKLGELILADAQEKILIIIPINLDIIEEKKMYSLIELADNNSTEYINRITNENFDNITDAAEFFKGSKTVPELFTKFRNINLLPREFANIRSLTKFLDNFSFVQSQTFVKLNSVEDYFGMYLTSQFRRVQEHKYFCNKIMAEPIYDNPIPWFFFNYEIGGSGIDYSIINALQKEKFEWIGNIPLNAIKVLREENELEYIRSILRKGITDLKAKTDEDLFLVSEQLSKNLNEAFKKQKDEMSNLEKKVKKITNQSIPITILGGILGFIPGVNIPFSIGLTAKATWELIKAKSKLHKKLEKDNNFITILMENQNE